MTDAQRKLVELSERYEALKEEMKAIKPTMQDLMKEIGVGTMFQSDDGIVFRVETPTGTYVSFDPITYTRTKKIGEDKGSLAKSAAEAAGFILIK